MWARTDTVYVFNILQTDKINVVGGNRSLLEASSACCKATAKEANNYSTAGFVLHLRLQQTSSSISFRDFLSSLIYILSSNYSNKKICL